ncbi:MAG: DUF4404 family protein [Candidatus Sericytochromatia bacterium]
MSTSSLSQALIALRAQLAELHLSAAERSRLENLVGQIESEISADPATASAHAELPSLIERFEVEHPTLTQALNRVMVSLSNMGI